MGGILADDMGLGKTIQTIMLLKKHSPKQTNKPSLIIMPKTLLFNWEQEFRSFAPNLSILCYEGSTRKKQLAKFNEHDIIIASYNSIRIDIEELKTFHLIIASLMKHNIQKTIQPTHLKP